MADMSKKLKENPTSYSPLCHWIVLINKPEVLCALYDGNFCVQPVHSIEKYGEPVCHRDAYDDK